MHNSVRFAIYLLACKCLRHVCRHLYAVISVRHLCQDKCSRDQNWQFECSFDFPSPINVYELEFRTTANYNYTHTGKTGISGRGYYILCADKMAFASIKI